MVKLVITDANIIIDLQAGGLLELMFRLPGHEFAVPDLLYASELEAGFAELPALGLQVKPLRPEVVRRTDALRRLYPHPSLNDLFALALAEDEACMLLTGDRALREAASAEDVDVHGYSRQDRNQEQAPCRIFEPMPVSRSCSVARSSRT